MKKEKLLACISMFFSMTLYSQVGINTLNPNATFEVASSANNVSKTDGFIAPKLKGTELKAKDALYGINQDGAIIYITEALAPNNVSPKTRNILSTGYYHFNGTIWVRFVDVARVPVTVTVFNGSGTSVAGTHPSGTETQVPFPNVNIIPDTTIGIWNDLNAFTVVKRGVYMISAIVTLENLNDISVIASSIRVKGGTQGFALTQSSIGTSLQLNTTGCLILNPGDVISIGTSRNAAGSSYTFGPRSINITFSEIN